MELDGYGIDGYDGCAAEDAQNELAGAPIDAVHDGVEKNPKGEDGNLVIDEEQAMIVKRIYREFLSGSSSVAIAKGLTNDGIETPGHKQKWYATTVRSILTNEKYKGDALLQKHYTVDFLTKKQKINKKRRRTARTVRQNRVVGK